MGGGAVAEVGRRRFLIAASALLAAPSLARAQQPGRTFVVGTLLRGREPDKASYVTVLREQLALQGLVEGRNLRFEHGAFGGDGIGSGEEAARRLLEANPDAILSTFDGITEGAMRATKSVPIVFTWVSDPVALGIAASLARPGGNATGVSTRRGELTVKRLELALELAPAAKRIAIIGAGRFWPGAWKGLPPAIAEVAAKSGRELLDVGWNLGRSIRDAHRAGAQVALTPVHSITLGYRAMLDIWVQDSIELRLPVIYVGREEVEAGGLVSYGTNILDDLRRAASLLARVLKGENPAKLPVDQSSRFELALNLKTAKAMGISIPPSIELRADRVIE